MRRTTKKLSGPAMQRYLQRFFADEPDLAPEMAQRLAVRSAMTFSSLRVRAMPLARLRLRTPAKAPRPGPTPAPTAGKAPSPSTAAVKPATAAAGFDPYSIGLVPTLQREGRDGLIAKLRSVGNIDNLRKMARAQQVVLPEALRQGDVPLDQLRGAIADAVARRVADRRAAAG